MKQIRRTRKAVTTGHPIQLRKSMIAMAISGLLSVPAHANPTGAQVVHGNVQFTNGRPGELNITNTPGAIVNWNNFSISQNELTRFVQQNGASAILNRVVGQDPTSILGQLLSNGRVFLINPNGMVFGKSAVIDTAGLVASTLNISDADFIAGRMHFKGDGEALDNKGFIRVNGGGDVMLIAPDVTNSGIIHADDGSVLLAAGREIAIESLDLEHIRFRVQAPQDKVVNLGRIVTTNGIVALFAGSLHHGGQIEANRISQDADGVVHLQASESLIVTGTIDATGSGTRGGDISITANKVELRGASLDVSGDNGGGRAHIGGNYQGKGNLANARNTSLDADTVVRADARIQGDGGEVIVWSDGETRSFAKLTARGGPIGGDGGFVETSGKGSLFFGQPADVSAPAGKGGTWLLDPEDITIGEGEAESISSALNTGSNVQIKTSSEGSGEGNITVASAIEKTEGDDASLALDAHNRIDVNAPIRSSQGKLDVSLKAGNAIHVNANIDTNGGGFAQVVTELSTEIPQPEDDLPEEETASAPETAIEPDELVVEITEPSTDSADLADEEGISSEPGPQVEAAEFAAQTEVEVLISSGEFKADLEILVDADIDTNGGDIFIDAGLSGSAGIYEDLDASSDSGTGGNVTVLGDKVGLFEDARIDASGENGGGEVLFGGDQQGNNPEVPNASAVYLGPDAEIRTDAITSGDGGRVIVYADDSARIYGNLSARGGSAGGDGGFIETSGKKSFDIQTSPDVSAPNGEGGTWLIDPYNVEIIGGESNGLIGSGNPFQPNNPSDTIGVDAILTAMNGGATVRIVTDCPDEPTCGGEGQDGNITLSADIDYNSSGGEYGGSFYDGADGTLVLEAANEIFFEADIYDSYGGSVDLFNLEVVTGSPDTTYIDGHSLNVNDFTADSHVVIRNGGSLDVGGDAHFKQDLDVYSSGYGGEGPASLNVYGNAEFDGTVDIYSDGDYDAYGSSAQVTAYGGTATFGGDVRVYSDNYGGHVFLDIDGIAEFKGSLDIYNNYGGASARVSINNGAARFKGDVTLYSNAYSGAEVHLDIHDDGTSNTDASFDAEVNLASGAEILLGDEAIARFNDTFNWTGGTLAESSGESESFYIASGAVANLTGPDFKLFRDAHLVNEGTINWSNGNLVDWDGCCHSRIDNYGTLNKTGGSNVETLYVELTNDGAFDVQGGSVAFYSDDDGVFHQTGGNTNLGGGDIAAYGGEGGTLFFSGGSITGTGSIFANVCVGTLADGCDPGAGGVTIAPGNSLGTIDIETMDGDYDGGNLALSPDSFIEVELGGPPPADLGSLDFPLTHVDTNADVLNVEGYADLNGATIKVGFTNGYTPSAGDVFPILHVSGGEFADYNGGRLQTSEGLVATVTGENTGSYVVAIDVESYTPPVPPLDPPVLPLDPPVIPPSGNPPSPGNGPLPPQPPGGPFPGIPPLDGIDPVIAGIDYNPPPGVFDPDLDEDERRKEIGMCTR